MKSVNLPANILHNISWFIRSSGSDKAPCIKIDKSLNPDNQMHDESLF